MYVPSMSDIGRLLDASTAEVQLTLSSYLVDFAVGQIIYGPISDRHGRKSVLLMALLLSCAGSLARAAATTHRKVDRRALRQWRLAPAPAAWMAMQSRLAAVWPSGRRHNPSPRKGA
jgi:MFS family permease